MNNQRTNPPSFSEEVPMPTIKMGPYSDAPEIIIDADPRTGLPVAYEQKTQVVRHRISDYTSQNPKAFRAHVWGACKSFKRHPLESFETLFALVGFGFCGWFLLLALASMRPTAQVPSQNGRQTSIWFPQN